MTKSCFSTCDVYTEECAEKSPNVDFVNSLGEEVAGVCNSHSDCDTGLYCNDDNPEYTVCEEYLACTYSATDTAANELACSDMQRDLSVAPTVFATCGEYNYCTLPKGAACSSSSAAYCEFGTCNGGTCAGVMTGSPGCNGNSNSCEDSSAYCAGDDYCWLTNLDTDQWGCYESSDCANGTDTCENHTCTSSSSGGTIPTLSPGCSGNDQNCADYHDGAYCESTDDTCYLSSLQAGEIGCYADTDCHEYDASSSTSVFCGSNYCRLPIDAECDSSSGLDECEIGLSCQGTGPEYCAI